MSNFRNNLLLANFFLLLLFNAGYMQMRLPQAQIGVPISEWLLLFTVATAYPLIVIGRMRNLSLLLPYFLWLSYGAAIIFLSFLDHGVRAIRDGIPVIESLFLYVGFVFARDKVSLEKLEKWLPRVFVAGFFYCALYPFGETLSIISPTVSGMQGQPVPLLFNYMTTAMLLVVAAAFALEKYRSEAEGKYLFFAAVAIAMVLVFLASRTVLLMIFVLLTYFLITGTWRLSLGLLWMIGIGMALSLALLGLGIESTRLDITSLSDYRTLFLEMFPGTEATLTSGTSARLQWWLAIYEQLTSSWNNLLFGLGYGIPLTDLRVQGDVIVYTPHNSIVSVFARGGLVAGLTFIWLQSVIVYRAWEIVRDLRKKNHESSLYVALLFIVLTVLVYSIGEAPFVTPCFAVPYYFSAGILLRMNSNKTVDW